MKGWSRHTEILLIGFCLFCLLLLFINWRPAQLLVVAGFTLLGMYYLLSGLLVMISKSVNRIVRFIYFSGLWGMAIGLLGVSFRLKFWYHHERALMVGLVACLLAAVLAFINFYRRKGADREENQKMMQPLLGRIILLVPVFFLALMVNTQTLYKIFGPHRSDKEYTRLLIYSLDNPSDTSAFREVENYKNKYFHKHDPPPSPEKSR